MQRVERPAQTREQPPALGTLAEMVLDPRPRRVGKLAVHVARHLARRPPVVPAEAEPVKKAAHDGVTLLGAETVQGCRCLGSDPAPPGFGSRAGPQTSPLTFMIG